MKPLLIKVYLDLLHGFQTDCNSYYQLKNEVTSGDSLLKQRTN